MSASINKVILIGNVGQDPEQRFTGSGKAVANVSLATSFKSGDSEKTEWHKVIFWDKLAEVVSKYVTKGSSIYVEGRLETRSWDDKDGAKKYTTEIVAEKLQLLGSKKDDTTESVPAPARKSRKSQTDYTAAAKSEPDPFE